MELGNSFLYQLLQKGDPIYLLKVEEDWFLEESIDLYNFIRSYYEKHKKLPSVYETESATGISLIKEEANIDFLVEELKRRNIASSIMELTAVLEQRIRDKKPEEAQNILKNYLIEKIGKKESIVNFFDYGERFDEYEKIRNANADIFYPTPWQSLNEMIRGWERGTLNVLTAITRTGKTWISCFIANHLIDNGKKVMYVSMEMPIFRIARRIDSIRYKIPFDLLFKPEEYIEEYKDLLERWKEGVIEERGKHFLYILDKKNVRTVQEIKIFYNIYLPDVIIIDGGYRLRGRGKGSWEQNVSIVRDLQLLSEETNIPVIVTTQLGDASEKGRDSKKSMRLWNVRFAKEWSIDPDVVIGLRSLRDEDINDEIEIHPLKVRDIGGATIRPFRIKLNKETCEFNEVEYGELASFSEDIDDLEMGF